MSSSSTGGTDAVAAGSSGSMLQLGRVFVHPAFDYLAIGGGLSLLLLPWLPAAGNLMVGSATALALPYCVLLFNSAHFAASTVRLYTKPDARREFPFLTMGFPLVTLAVLAVALAVPELVGRNLNKLYLTWSPYHYAAQAYGLALMYAHRSGCRIADNDKRALRWICMLPFLYAFVAAPNTGLAWFVPAEVFVEHPALDQLRAGLRTLLIALTFVAPSLFVRRIRERGGAPFPAISLLLLASNGVWWIVFDYVNAFLWATVFHGVQYLAIVAIFDLRDHPAPSGRRWGWLPRVLRFYAICVALGYLLFHVWPYAYLLAGFPLAESMLLVAAVINLHHFIVDAYIWRLSKAPTYALAMAGSRS